MPTVVRAQVRFVASSTKTEDDVTNTWHFRVNTLPPPGATLTAIHTALSTFYNAIGGLLVGEYNTIIPVKYFDLNDPEPRVPITTLNITMGAYGSATSPAPRETAMVLSVKAAAISGVDNRSRRGRIYLGPIESSAMLGTGLFNSTFTAQVATAANALLTTSTAASDWDWTIYSRAHNTDAPVVSGFCDNAPDIQRRRGRDSTNRSVFP